MFKNTKKGFTLIELLVVIAIIGLMASVVLASLNSARAKAADAAVKSNLTTLRSQGALFYEVNQNYGTAGLCTVAVDGTLNGFGGCPITIVTDQTFLSALRSATAASGNAGNINVAVNGSAWAALVPLKSNATNVQCVDSAGASVTLVSPTMTITVCP